ncbi:hypothetical protein I5M27_14480 [Adhaeribacter sp. BT258]|uniref:Lipoprotein n=1 Tax=Adhaeribacter terrigena TaxID=2793070 RepID=A0ABS1C472_9BACT|nr:hypothetical protein [Adhaeribacter terrigena]MBK0404199.1 hypothetical protein [Adhaeribacter terrigena]
MKKLRTFYLSMLTVASLGLMTSCGDDNDDPQPVTPPAAAEMNTFSARILGNQNNATSGSFFSATDGVVRNSTDAKTNSGLIDLIYYHSSPLSGDTAAANHAATLASPEDTKAGEVYNNANNGIQTWTTTNTTMFKRIGTNTATYTNLTNGDQVAAVYTNSTATPTTSVKKLKANDVFAFVTSTGKHGVAKINSIVAPTAANNNQSELRMDVKMEK